VPRSEQFEDVYSCEDPVEDMSDTDSDADYGIDDSKLRAVRQRWNDARAALNLAQSNQETATSMMGFLKSYGQNMLPEHIDVSQVSEFVELYRQQCAVEGEREIKATAEVSLQEEQVLRLNKKLRRLDTAYERAKEAASKEARRVRAKRQREMEQKRKQHRQKMNERRKYWTNNISQVIVHLDGYSESTSSSVSTRRNARTVDRSETINLRLTYVVPLASWASRYEVSINTPASSAHIIYRAEFQNCTTETWQDTTVSLSTSQAAFSRLDERVPGLQAWHVQLRATDDDTGAWNSVMESKTEINMKMQQQPHGQKRPNPFTDGIGRAARRSQLPRRAFGGKAARIAVASDDVQDEENEEHEEEVVDSGTISPPPPDMLYQSSVRQDYGLTTTYELPGQRTLIPSSTPRRHILAELDLTTVTLSHILIPKLRPAAFLTAKIQNTSAVTLLSGKAGITVDGTFLGSSIFPACAPDDFCNLSLGVDPSILVTYGKPAVRRATTGIFFNKEDCAIFTRTCWIKNTKNTAVSISVLDQIPVSEDEKLRVNILEPKGLEKEGDRAGLFHTSDGQWGQGVASLEKNGEVKWVITLEKGKDVKLVLEYEVKLPKGHRIVGLD
jgi:hypothetical protein